MNEIDLELAKASWVRLLAAIVPQTPKAGIDEPIAEPALQARYGCCIKCGGILRKVRYCERCGPQRGKRTHERSLNP